ncbi:unnamed protein product [Adineta steineri]|uniref:Uncharacterized protein n=1 Tax=Adineta steineri TaxID=433720 RepID=A0A815NJ10_9BILA|nr:unnamed protein product [Adineta steineri]CAF1435274.1 unnamed protein product [Adineta steineri]
MAIKRNFSPNIRTKIYRTDGNILQNYINHNFHVQTAPPLSLQQYARSVSTLPGSAPWQSLGIYHPPKFHSYLSPETRNQSKLPEIKPWIYSYRRKYSIPKYSLKPYKDRRSRPPEPIWHPISPYINKRPTSLSPEKRWQKRIHEPIWHPVSPYLNKHPTSLNPEKRWQKKIHEPVWQPIGSIQYKSLPYFDPPSLRWSLQKLLKSTPNL